MNHMPRIPLLDFGPDELQMIRHALDNPSGETCIPYRAPRIGGGGVTTWDAQGMSGGVRISDGLGVHIYLDTLAVQKLEQLLIEAENAPAASGE